MFKINNYIYDDAQHALEVLLMLERKDDFGCLMSAGEVQELQMLSKWHQETYPEDYQYTSEIDSF